MTPRSEFAAHAVLKSGAGTVTRRFTIQKHTTILSIDLSGWPHLLAIRLLSSTARR